MSKLIRFLSSRWTRGRDDIDTVTTKRQLSAGDVVCYGGSGTLRDRQLCRVTLLDGTDLACELPVGGLSIV